MAFPAVPTAPAVPAAVPAAVRAAVGAVHAARAVRRLPAITIGSLLALSFPFPASAIDRYVDCQNGSDATGDGTVTRPWKTIQNGVDNSSAGDTVRIKAGVCDDSNQLAFPVDMRAGVSVVGAGRTQTFIRNQGSATGVAAFYFAFSGASFPPSQLIADMDIYTESDGVALWNGSPTIRNNVIHGGSIGINILSLYPGEAASPTIEDNTLTDLGEGIGAAALDGAVDPVVRRNWFLGSTTAGIAQYAINAQDVGIRHHFDIQNNMVAGSRIGFGFLGGSPTLRNNTITATDTAIQFSSDVGTEVQVTAMDNNIIAYNGYGVVELGDAETTVTSLQNNDFFINGDDYFDWALGPVGDPNSLPGALGNLAVNPTFMDPTRGDYHIHPSSPCRDAGRIAGAPGDDIDKQARSDGAPDIGADETSNIGSPNLKVTGHVTVADFCPGFDPPGRNGVIDPGESADIRWQITNLSAFARATNVVATISGDPDIFPQPQVVTLGRINPLKTVESALYSFMWQPTGFNCGAKIRFSIVLSSDETGPLPAQAYEIKRASCTPCSNAQTPDPRLDASTLVDTCANGVPPGGNGSIEPGEDGHLTLQIRNFAAVARASDVKAQVTTSNPAVSPQSATVLIGNIDPGATASNAVPFDFSVDASQISCGGSITFSIALSWVELAGGPPVVSPLTFTVPASCVDCSAVAPAFVLGSRTFNDTCTTRPGNGQIDPGERLDLTVRVQNSSAQAGASNVTGVLYALTAGVTPPSVPLSFGAIAPGATVAAAPVQVRVDKAVACGVTLNFEVELSSDQTGTLPTRLPFSLGVANPCLLCDDVPPTLTLSGPSFVDRCPGSEPPGNNGQIDPGESVELTLNVFNSSSVATATNVRADIMVSETWVTPGSDSLPVGTVPPLQIQPSSRSFSFAVQRSPSLCGQFINVNVTLDSLETGPVPQPPLRLLVDSCSVCPVPVPELQIAAQSFGDRCPFGNPPGGNGRVDPGELIDLVLEIDNGSSFAPATGVTAVFSTAVGGISPASGSVAGPDIGPGASGTLDAFSFAIDYNQLSCGAIIPFDVRLSSVESGPLPLQRVDVVVASGCTVCRDVVTGLLLRRASVPAVAPGWKASVLPLLSTTPGQDGAPWPLGATAPGTQDDASVLGNGTPLMIYRLLDPADVNQGNILRAAKKPASSDITITY